MLITNRGLHCYKVMPFGLKNAGATYQRLVNKLFEPLIGQTMEVYVDDMIIKSKLESDHGGDFGVQYEAQPEEVRLWGSIGQISWFHY